MLISWCESSGRHESQWVSRWNDIPPKAIAKENYFSKKGFSVKFFGFTSFSILILCFFMPCGSPCIWYLPVLSYTLYYLLVYWLCIYENVQWSLFSNVCITGLFMLRKEGRTEASNGLSMCCYFFIGKFLSTRYIEIAMKLQWTRLRWRDWDQDCYG